MKDCKAPAAHKGTALFITYATHKVNYQCRPKEILSHPLAVITCFTNLLWKPYKDLDHSCNKYSDLIGQV